MSCRVLPFAVNDTPVFPFVVKDEETGLVVDITNFTITMLLRRDDGTMVAIPHTAVDAPNGAGKWVISVGDLTGRRIRVDVEEDDGNGEVITDVEAFRFVLGENLGGQ